MKIQPPNYTQAPNDLFDYWLPLLGEAELKVLLVIMRKTFGWHKVRDQISITQLAQLTGMLEETVINATKTLQKKGVIKKEVTGTNGTQKTYYQLVVQEVSNNSYPSVKPSGPLGLDPGVSTEAQKKAISSKEETATTKKEAAAPIAAVVSLLKEFNLEQSAIDALSIFSEERIKLAIEFVKSKQAKGVIDSVEGTLIWHCKQKNPPKPPMPKKAEPAPTKADEKKSYENREYAGRFYHENRERIGHLMNLNINYIRLGSDELYFDNLRFEELFNHYIRKIT